MIIHYIVKKRTSRYCLQVFSKAERLKRHVDDCFRIDATQMIMPKKGKYGRFKIKKIK